MPRLPMSYHCIRPSVARHDASMRMMTTARCVHINTRQQAWLVADLRPDLAPGCTYISNVLNRELVMLEVRLLTSHGRLGAHTYASRLAVIDETPSVPTTANHSARSQAVRRTIHKHRLRVSQRDVRCSLSCKRAGQQPARQQSGRIHHAGPRN